MSSYVERTLAAFERLDEENAKLRELVRDMWPHVRHRASMCMACELGNECAASDEPCLLYASMEDRMRELGIEEE